MGWLEERKKEGETEGDREKERKREREKEKEKGRKFKTIIPPSTRALPLPPGASARSPRPSSPVVKLPCHEPDCRIVARSPLDHLGQGREKVCVDLLSALLLLLGRDSEENLCRRGASLVVDSSCHSWVSGAVLDRVT